MKKYMQYAVLPALGLGLIGIGTASAQGLFWGGNAAADPGGFAQRQDQMFQKEADLLGISLDEVKSGWAQGKSLKDIAAEKGVTQDQLKQKMQDMAQAQLKANLQALVDQGVITQAQADQRLQFMQAQARDGMKMRHHRGFGF